MDVALWFGALCGLVVVTALATARNAERPLTASGVARARMRS